MWRVIRLLVLVGTVGSPQAAAQVLPLSSLVNNLIEGQVLRNSVARTTGNASSTPSALSAPPTGAGAAVTSLTFRYDSAVTRRVQGQLLAGVRRTSGPQDVAALEAALTSGELRRAYEGVMRSLGVDHGRFEDALDPLALCLMVLWGVTNNTDFTPTPAMLRAVRAQVGRTYAAMPALLDTGDKRQEFGETLIYQSVLLIMLHNELLRRGAPERRAIADQMHGAFLDMLGFDLRRVVLTEQGFTGRK